MTPKTTSPWTAGRKTALSPAPKVRCEGGKCIWSDGRAPLSLRLRAASFRLKGQSAR